MRIEPFQSLHQPELFQQTGGNMYFDWITWSIWLIGFLIMIIWIYVPYKEFRGLLARRKKAQTQSGHQE